MDALLQDLRYAARRLRGSRSFTIAVVLTMARAMSLRVAARLDPIVALGREQV